MNKEKILDKHLDNIFLSGPTRKAVLEAMSEYMLFAIKNYDTLMLCDDISEITDAIKKDTNFEGLR